MNTIRKAVAVAACLMAATPAYAQFGALAGMLGGNSGNSAASSGDVATDVATFVAKIGALSEMASRSVTAINAAFASEEQIAAKRAALLAINQLTDPKEKAAKSAALYESESAEAKRLLESGEMEKRIGGLDSEKKTMIGNALLNFGIGSLQAVDLSKSGQSLLQNAGSNPMNIPKIVPVKNAIPLLGKVAGDAGGFIVGVARLAKGANIAVPTVKADSKPADIEV